MIYIVLRDLDSFPSVFHPCFIFHARFKCHVGEVSDASALHVRTSVSTRERGKSEARRKMTMSTKGESEKKKKRRRRCVGGRRRRGHVQNAV